ncbi:MAG: hypothetical protein DSZ28_01645 [Thiothrix sp.]|nr:MAG: hypothetical protein DSZ28_01645 [Thiothrix sp.]
MKFITTLIPVLACLLLLTPLSAADFSAPLITLPVAQPVEKGADTYRISAEVSDETGVVSVDVRYRNIGNNDEFKTLALAPTRNGKIYAATIKIDPANSQGIEYYIEARDSANNISEEPFPDAPRQIHFPDTKQAKKSSHKKYWWMALGALAIGAVAANKSGDDNNDDTVTLTIDAADP